MLLSGVRRPREDEQAELSSESSESSSELSLLSADPSLYPAPGDDL